MAFQRYRHIEADITAALMGADTVKYILERILRDVAADEMQSFTMNVGFGDVYTISFRYRDSDVVHTLTDGMYLLELNDGTLYAATAEDFTSNYEWVDPETQGIVGTGIVGKARLMR